MSADAGRLGPLRRAKLKALVRDGRFGGSLPDGLVDGSLPGGATLRTAAGDRGWVLVDDGAVAGFGAALAWAVRDGVPFERLEVLVDGSATAPGVVARRAAGFRGPVRVSAVEGRSLRDASPAPASAAVLSDDLPADVLDRFAAELSAHGADPIVEHGVLRGEVLGLEVARAVLTEGVDGPEWRLAVGVGAHDRDAREQLRPGQAVGDALDEVVALVRRWRGPGELRHPANTLARERWLRALLVARPEVVGARSLVPLPTALVQSDLRDAAPAAALGTAVDGGASLLVVCSVGVDLDLVPTAADLRVLHDRSAAVRLVVPVGDDLPVTRTLAGLLVPSGEVVTVPRDWASTLA